jgi:hypothetical protein
MKKKVINTLIGDIFFLGLLIFCVSRIQFIIRNSPVIAIAIPIIWFLFGAKFIYRKNIYEGLIKDKLLFRWAILCVVMGALSLLFVIVSFVCK